MLFEILFGRPANEDGLTPHSIFPYNISSALIPSLAPDLSKLPLDPTASSVTPTLVGTHPCPPDSMGTPSLFSLTYLEPAAATDTTSLTLCWTMIQWMARKPIPLIWTLYPWSVLNYLHLQRRLWGTSFLRDYRSQTRFYSKKPSLTYGSHQS
ncbi:hypothetical protein SARC_06318 [Sphaeroforma arctica JP610]|uniref:Uncharacterized protein n=1 Tax=Sphaeroforma arctica JP610 TaxID=667725 RepID=A0A0L0FZG5_9EUKA|nr:hypothetical protein SARC_06318 [Sphaeroforma arctica JP610]KNC81358.1 hypothetical protein SARC_06318 [Sphaeroforma arctica JP610]|eukprot:XP_014155260.1 hypothetical protein SARC_06318 [Sphaeroforma arctica JP610]